MELCENNHSEIVHNDGWKECPLCKAFAQIERMEDKIAELESKLSDAEYEIKLLTKELEELKQ